MSEDFSCIIGIIRATGANEMAITKPRKHAENINFRPDEKIAWGLWFGMRVSGRSKQHIVETAVTRELDRITIGDKRWSDFWHPEEGVRALRFLFSSAPDLVLTAEEEERHHFIDTYRPFFFEDDGAPSVERLRALWPSIDDLVERWVKTRASDPTACGRHMADLLKGKGRKVPKEWIEYAAVRSDKDR